MKIVIARKADGFDDLDSMFGILDKGRQLLDQRCHGVIKSAGDEFSGTTKGRKL